VARRHGETKTFCRQTTLTTSPGFNRQRRICDFAGSSLDSWTRGRTSLRPPHCRATDCIRTSIGECPLGVSVRVFDNDTGCEPSQTAHSVSSNFATLRAPELLTLLQSYCKVSLGRMDKVGSVSPRVSGHVGHL
jgi:hypothetical protein